MMLLLSWLFSLRVSRNVNHCTVVCCTLTLSIAQGFIAVSAYIGSMVLITSTSGMSNPFSPVPNLESLNILCQQQHGFRP